MTCKDCLHFSVCEALEQGNGIKKVYPIQCGCFKNKADVVELPDEMIIYTKGKWLVLNMESQQLGEAIKICMGKAIL